MNAVQINDKSQKRSIARQILEALHEWFEMEEGREQYISECADQLFFAAYEEDSPVGFIALKATSPHTAEIAVMGVLKEYHRRGTGALLFNAAKKAASEQGYSFIQVKTVKMGVYEDYDRTNRFYLSLGFRELEVLPIWDEANPCQIYIMYIGSKE